MAKEDPKDSRIAELELSLEAANKATADAENRALRVTGLEAENKDLLGKLDSLANEIKRLTGELAELRNAANPGERAAVTGLDPEKAVELKVSSMVLNATTKQAVVAVAGSVLVEKSAFTELAKKLGAQVTLHPVEAQDIEDAKKSGRAY